MSTRRTENTAILTAGRKCLLSHGVRSMLAERACGEQASHSDSTSFWEWTSSRKWAACISTKEARHILLRRLSLWVRQSSWNSLTFKQSSTNAPNPEQCRGSGPGISHQEKYTTEYPARARAEYERATKLD